LEIKKDLAAQEDMHLLKAVPVSTQEKDLTRKLCKVAVETSVRRHAGVIMDSYTPTGRKQTVRGKDLTSVKWVIGTGGALTRIDGGEEILHSICTGAGKYLLPPPDVSLLIDRDYRFSAFGTLAQDYPDQVKATFQKWVESECR
jgi:uncharacterized protein (TIGR01319 family)